MDRASPKTSITWTTTGDRVTRATGPDGHVLFDATWAADGSLAMLTTRMPRGDRLELVTGRGEHPIIGPCDALRHPGAHDVLAYCGRVQWHRPQRIPALDRPAALPAGGGAALLNVLAWQAQRGDVTALTYCGPYPTSALFESLCGSFRVEGELARAEAIFTRDVEDAAIVGRMIEPAVAFIPDPHVWTWPSPRICVQHRHGIERVFIDGHAFDRDSVRPRRLVVTDRGEIAARVVLRERTVCEVLRLSAGGDPLHEPIAMPPAAADLAGQPLPAEVLPVLAEAIAAETPSLLRAAVRDVLAPGKVRWGDPGLALVLTADDGVIVHAGLVAHLPEEPVALLDTLVELFSWPVRRLAQRRLSEAAEALLRR